LHIQIDGGSDKINWEDGVGYITLTVDQGSFLSDASIEGDGIPAGQSGQGRSGMPLSDYNSEEEYPLTFKFEIHASDPNAVNTTDNQIVYKV